MTCTSTVVLEMLAPVKVSIAQGAATEKTGLHLVGQLLLLKQCREITASHLQITRPFLMHNSCSRDLGSNRCPRYCLDCHSLASALLRHVQEAYLNQAGLGGASSMQLFASQAQPATARRILALCARAHTLRKQSITRQKSTSRHSPPSGDATPLLPAWPFSAPAWKAPKGPASAANQPITGESAAWPMTTRP